MKRSPKKPGPAKGSPSTNPAGRNTGGQFRTERLEARIDPGTMSALRRQKGSLADAVIRAVAIAEMADWPVISRSTNDSEMD